MSATLKITPPPQGAKIAIQDGKLRVPENPIIPFIEGDGTGPDIWRASVRLMDAAVAKAYGGKRRIHDAHARAPDVGPGAIPFDEGDDRVFRDAQLAVLDGDLRALRRRCHLRAGCRIHAFSPGGKPAARASPAAQMLAQQAPPSRART